MIDAAPLSPVWWREKLIPRLEAQAREAERYQRYYDGQFPDWGIVTKKYREEFGQMLGQISDNWMQLVVDAEAERMHVEGIRVGDEPEADRDAWEMWQRAALDSDSGIAHTTALTCGRCYVMVAPGREWPTITVEHPSQMIVATDPGNRRIRRAALKRWVDDWTGDTHVTLQLPEGLFRWRSASGTSKLELPRGVDPWRELDGDPNPLGVVTVVPLVNRPDLFGGGRSELETVMSTQDQINKLVCDMIVASEFQAFQQRWATGVELALDPTTGRTKDFEPGPGAVWHVPDEMAKFGAFPHVDLGVYPKLLENRIQSVASRTRTPPHYMLGSTGVFPSGESLKATETGLIAKAQAEMRHLDEGWEEILRLGFRAKGDPRAEEFRAEMIWRDPESRTEAEHIDAVGKKRKLLEVPLPQVWEDAGYTPVEIARFRQMALEEAFHRAVAGGGLAPTVDDQVTEPEPAGV